MARRHASAGRGTRARLAPFPRRAHGFCTRRGPDLHRRTAIPSKVFVGNLSYTTTKEELTELFTEAGQVVDVYLPTDRATERPRGFAFVQFATDEAAQEAITRFNGREMGGRPLKVDAAQDRPPRGEGGPRPFTPRPSFGADRAPYAGPPTRNKGSRRGLRAKKRSL